MMQKIIFKIFLGFIFLIKVAYATGQNTYEQYCSVCHAGGLAGAPKFHSKQDWSQRCQTKHLKGLVGSAIKGINAMPSKGTCSSCEEKDILEAIKYMVPNESICH